MRRLIILIMKWEYEKKRCSRGMITKVWPVDKPFEVINKSTIITCVTLCYICSEVAVENTWTKSVGYVEIMFSLFFSFFFSVLLSKLVNF